MQLRLEELEGRVLLAAYYVSPSGSDSNSGTSTSAPWKTISKVNAADLNPGDSVNFQGGATFTTSTPLKFTDPADNGSATNPIVINSYGTGRATISVTGNINAVEGQHVSGYKITNLNFQGPGWGTSTKSGIYFYAWASGNLKYLHIENVNVSGFGHAGIQIQASNGVSTYQDIQVTNADLSGNKFVGFETIGPGAGGDHSARTIFDVHLYGVRVLNNAGISIGSVYGGVIEHSISGNNGYTGDVATGIFVYDSSYITIRNNEFYGMKNYGTNTDGNGITLDYGADHCIVEHNYTHDNGGAGILLVGSNKPGYPATTNNIVRYNISENDGQMYSFAAISAYRGVSNALFYGNTVYNTQRDAFQIWDWKGSSIYVLNNIFMVKGNPTQYVINVFPPSDTSQNLSQLELVFRGNNYYTSGGAFNIHYGNGFYFNLNSWRNATDQEKLFGMPVGSSVNPLLNNPGGGGTIGNTNSLDNLWAYQLQQRSRMRFTGLNIETIFGIDMGSWDFFGNALPSGQAIAVGAHDPFENGGRSTGDGSSGRVGITIDSMNESISIGDEALQSSLIDDRRVLAVAMLAANAKPDEESDRPGVVQRKLPAEPTDLAVSLTYEWD